MRVQLHLKCVEEEGGGGFVVGESHSERGNKENKYEEIHMRGPSGCEDSEEGENRVKMEFQY